MELINELLKVAKKIQGYKDYEVIQKKNSQEILGVIFNFLCRTPSYEEQLLLQEVVTPGNPENYKTENIRCYGIQGVKKSVNIIITF